MLEVATFYTQFQLKPVGTRAHIQVCGTTPCMLRGSEALMDVCRSKIHHDQFHTNDKGTLSWEEVECLGACVNAPMVMIFKDTFEDLTPERLGRDHRPLRCRQGRLGDAGTAERPHHLRADRGPDDADKRKGDPQVDPRQGSQGGGQGRQGGAGRDSRSARAGSRPPPVAPSNAGKPKTDAPETSPALKSPSAVKVAPAAEKTASVSAPPHSAANANAAAPEVEKVAKQRNGPKTKAEPAAAFKAPEAKAPARRQTPSRQNRRSRTRTVRPASTKPALVDDLKLISGVGPEIEGILHTLGIFTFAQVASWKKAEREWVDGYLSFHGRIDRDDWVKQAKALAKGGVAEYIRVFGKKPV